jgi:hypothetical protein
MRSLAIIACAVAITAGCFSCDEKAKQYSGTYLGDMMSAGQITKSDVKLYVGGVTSNQLYVYGIPMTKESEGKYVAQGESLANLIRMFYDANAIEKLEKMDMKATFSDNTMDLSIGYEIQLLGMPLSYTALSYHGKKISKSNQTE